MAKIIINESQLKVIYENIYIDNNINEEEILEEGIKDFIIGGLITLATISGLKAQKKGDVTPNQIKAAIELKDKLKTGDLDGDGVKDISKYFNEADIELNNENLKKLLSVDDEDIITFKTKNPSTAKAKLKQGYVLKSIDKKTEHKRIIRNSSIDTLISFKIDDNLFKTGDFKLNDVAKKDLKDLVSNILGDDDIEDINVVIESSTDKEPIKMGNEKLAKLRAESVKEILNEIGVNDSDIHIITKPNQGPDIYSKMMTPEEREKARELTKDYRYVKVKIKTTRVINELPSLQDFNKNYYNFELINKKDYKSGPKKIKFGKSKIDVKQEKCIVKVPKKGTYNCFFKLPN